ncbi:MFS transporter [Candidatus Lucifugimonas marina]|jgi:MFS family permease|uniref:MFS transporter n=1 Tax=Candidatus Lucifugimonas marina TaxID=3038979 RepID=A0AAJ5ZFA5_9CHLR|nr:MFS transporter [SAR202 cluster bacterium JH702]MDG0868454.1 MFS transporter [SAR202 cluster bacterium JH639]WFG35087.1 MFS transporter [SAR202 cluster bacterium JH545]WFG39044.1 MFS transporter [SAR202 cluster bacterium JH1073]
MTTSSPQNPNSSTEAKGPKGKAGRVFYGWWVALAGAMNMIVSSGPTFQAASTLFRAIEDEFGWSRAVVTGVASFGRFGGALLGPLEGWLTDKFGTGKMVLIGFTIGGFGLIGYSQLQGPVQYYVAYFTLSMGFSLGGFVPSMAAVNAWMPHKRATAMAIVIGGSSLGGVFVPLIVWGINTYGWRETTFVIGLITLAAGPPLAYIAGKRAPEYGDLMAQVTKTKSDDDKPLTQYDFTGKEALRTRAFWAISISHTLTNLSVGAISAHIYFPLTDKNAVGLSDTSAATILPIMAFSAFGFQMVGGFVGDRVNKRTILPVLILLQGAALVVLAHAGDYTTAVLFALLWGIGFGGRTPILHAMRGDYFGRKHFGVILGMSAFPMGLGMMAAPVIVGRVYDTTGTYVTSLQTLAAFCAIAAVTILLATKPTPPTYQPR